MPDQFVVKNLQDSAFAFDVTEKSQPMNVQVESPKQIAEVFNTIAYDKCTYIKI